MIEKILDKVLSGRFLLTIITGGVFIYSSVTKLLDAQAVSAIISMVMISYFQRPDRKKEEV